MFNEARLLQMLQREHVWLFRAYPTLHPEPDIKDLVHWRIKVQNCINGSIRREESGLSNQAQQTESETASEGTLQAENKNTTQTEFINIDKSFDLENMKRGESGMCPVAKRRKLSRAPPFTLSPQHSTPPPSFTQTLPPSVILGSGHETYDILLELETRPISHEQLVAGIRGIYAGLVMSEANCIEVNNRLASTESKLNNYYWEVLIELHRTLLYKHHDFFLASQHPIGTPDLRSLPIKYTMPARLWKYSIQ